ncbi:MAG: hypothetical protein HQM16_01095 [Deltaproteobacteria bacterium]|nr:hypothetical protein [Deltaproteobacteria bacterium]
MNTTKKRLLTGIVILLTGLSLACGDIKVKGEIDKDTVDTITDALGDSSDSSDSSQSQRDDSDSSYDDDSNTVSNSNSENEVSNTDDNTATNTFNDNTVTSNSDPNDPSGGISYFPESNKGSGRYFLGTYEINEGYTSCNDAYWGPGLEVPSILRAYSYSDKIDFETSFSQLVWGAYIYPDNTFDFRIFYLDTWGNPSVTLTCSCIFNEYDYWTDDMSCTCEASNDDGSCTLQYDKME